MTEARSVRDSLEPVTQLRLPRPKSVRIGRPFLFDKPSMVETYMDTPDVALHLIPACLDFPITRHVAYLRAAQDKADLFGRHADLHQIIIWRRSGVILGAENGGR